MRNIKDVLRLKYVGKLSHERIAVALGVSKGVVTKYAGLASAAGLNWELVHPMDEVQLHNRLINNVAPQSAFVLPNYGLIHQELRRKGMTLMLLWEEHVQRHGPDQTHRYAQFCVRYREYAKSLKRTMRQVHRAGEKLFIDFAGSTVGLRGGARAHIRGGTGRIGLHVCVCNAQRNNGRLAGCHGSGIDLLWWCHPTHRARQPQGHDCRCQPV